ncbi:exosortase B [Methylobacillus sp. Pita1]|uniref:exosortase B n=1 Tax=Methylobacillus sp. Pita1 TaxID=3382642 RepID=UPI0038B480ED
MKVTEVLQSSRQGLILFLPLLIGFLAMYVPTYWETANTIWVMEDQAHAPIIVLVIFYLIWVRKDFFLQPVPTISQFTKTLGTLSFLIGLLFYVVGRSQNILVFDLGSQIPILLGLILLMRGWPGLKAFWFPLFFILFMIPIPGAIVDSITMPMKIAVSYVAEAVLYGVGFPIARSGVILQIGPYQLLVADACAGLHTLISLEALGLLYLNIVRTDSIFRNITLAILIVPISFTANVIRVMTLTLITFYFGDAAGQGFMHGFAGMLLFVVALSLIIWMDTCLQFIERKYLRKTSTYSPA